jgi:hypothetical protein
MKKILLTTLVLTVVVAVLMLAAGSFDVIGAIRRMHGH